MRGNSRASFLLLQTALLPGSPLFATLLMRIFCYFTMCLLVFCLIKVFYFISICNFAAVLYKKKKKKKKNFIPCQDIYCTVWVSAASSTMHHYRALLLQPPPYWGIYRASPFADVCSCVYPVSVFIGPRPCWCSLLLLPRLAISYYMVWALTAIGLRYFLWLNLRSYCFSIFSSPQDFGPLSWSSRRPPFSFSGFGESFLALRLRLAAPGCLLGGALGGLTGTRLRLRLAAPECLLGGAWAACCLQRRDTGNHIVDSIGRSNTRCLGAVH